MLVLTERTVLHLLQLPREAGATRVCATSDSLAVLLDNIQHLFACSAV